MNFDCTDSEKFYELNRILGLKEETSTEEITSNELTPIASNENVNLSPPNKETNQRFKIPIAGPINNQNRISSAPLITNRNQIGQKKTTTNPFASVAQTDRTQQTTHLRESIGDSTEFIASTTFPPVNIGQYFDLTTRKPVNFPTTTFNGNADYTVAAAAATSTASNGNSALDYEQSTRMTFVPDLYESSNQSKADEVVESIKQLQKLFPSNNEDSREKRFLFKNNSVKNRQKLFDMLNQ